MPPLWLPHVRGPTLRRWREAERPVLVNFLECVRCFVVRKLNRVRDLGSDWTAKDAKDTKVSNYLKGVPHFPNSETHRLAL
jgi:hypothetical protein